MLKMKREKINVGQVSLSVLTAGPVDGAAVVVLHGFPERAESWIKHIEYLSSRGFFVIAPDQRGYEQSDKPQSISDYTLDILAADIIGLIDHFKKDSVYLIGHDWGCAVGWFLISFHAERFKKAILISSPHWDIFKKHLFTNPRQFLKSWYVFFIQLPKIPEFFVESGNYKNAIKELKKSAFNREYPLKELEELREGWSRNKSMPTMLNWYRALRLLKTPELSPKIKVPVTLLWGKRDPFFVEQMAEESSALCEEVELVILKNTGHWPHHENVAELHQYIDQWSI